MSWNLGEKQEWEFPHLRDAFQLPTINSSKHRITRLSNDKNEFWAVKFYPYSKPRVDPIYAVVGGRHIIICRPLGKDQKNAEIIKTIIDEDEETDNYACAWTKDLATGRPLICVAGANAKIKIIDVQSGTIQRTLAGHGGEIDDLAVSPINPYVLASASEDGQIRIWNLHPTHAEQPCVAILSDGHRDTISSIAFHNNGRYLLSGGVDHVINFWTVPEFATENTGTKKPICIQYPHFSTSEVHTDAVDCVMFHEDFIFSRSANENCIVLWAIVGFSSANDPPRPDEAPTSHDPSQSTLSYFKPTTSSQAYMRLIEFSAPETEILTMRFSIFPGLPNSTAHHPILACGNSYSKIYFWDLSRLEEYSDYRSALPVQLTHPHPSQPQIEFTSTPTASSAIASFSSESPNQPYTHSQPKRPPFLHTTRARIPRSSSNSTSNSHSNSRSKRDHHKDASNPNPVTRILRDQSPSASSTTSTSNSSSHLSQPALPLSHNPQPQPYPAYPFPFTTHPTTISDIRTWDKKYLLGRPLQRLLPHKEEVVKGLSFLGRQTAWSRGGEWCVVVGSMRCVGVLGRWEEGGEEKEREKERGRGRGRGRGVSGLGLALGLRARREREMSELDMDVETEGEEEADSE